MYNKLYCEFTTYYYPVVYQGEDTIQIWCLTDTGELRIEAITGRLYNGFTSDYVGNANYRSQPLFLMTDGSVKGYCSWRGEESVSTDDESFLYEISYEGGYHK